MTLAFICRTFLNVIHFFILNAGVLQMMKKIFFSACAFVSMASMQAHNNWNFLDTACTAIEEDNAQLVKELLDQGLSPNYIFEYGYTALITAVITGSLDVATVLLKHDYIDVNQRDKYGNTALHYAAALCDLDTVKLLLSHKNIVIDQRNTDSYGKTPLMLAVNPEPYEVIASYEYVVRDNTLMYQVIKVLVFAGANAQMVDGNGNKAADYTNNEILKELLKDSTAYIEKHTEEFQSIDEWYQQACPEKAHLRAVEYNKLGNRIARRLKQVKEKIEFETLGSRIKNKFSQAKTKVVDFFA